MQAIGTWKHDYETVLEDAHAHRVIVDLPIDEGGRSAGPSALELCVLSLAGCITTIFALVARRRRLAIQGMTVALEAERPRGAPTITRVHGTLRVRTRADPSEVETALRLTLKTCPVGVLFEKAQIPVEVTAIVQSPSVPG
ncbi:MAG: OsmC family protein [Thermoplasmata archaeon]